MITFNKNNFQLLKLENFAKLFTILLWTIFGLLVLNSFLSYNIDVAYTAIVLFAFILVILGSLGFIEYYINSLPATILIMLFYLFVVLLLKESVLIFPLVVFSLIFYTYSLYHIKISEFFDKNILLSAIFGVFMIMGAWIYTDFIIVQKLKLGLLYKDVLYHTSIASMIKTYSTISTGLHGLIPLNYHALSHGLFASLSILNGYSVIENYGYLSIMFLSPIFIFSISYASWIILDNKNISSYAIWNLVCLIFVFYLIIPSSNWAFQYPSWGSESFTLSIVFSMLILGLMSKKEIQLKELFLILIFIILIGITKASTGLILLGLIWLRSLVELKYKNKKLNLFLVLIATFIFYMVVMQSVADASNHNSFYIKPFDTVARWTQHGHFIEDIYQGIFTVKTIFGSIYAVIYFTILHFILSWIVIIYGLKRNNLLIGNLLNFGFLYSFGSVFAGMVIVSIFYFAGPNAHFFTIMGFFISFPFVVGILLNSQYEIYYILSKKAYFFIIYVLIFHISYLDIIKKRYFIAFKDKQYMKNHYQKDKLVSKLFQIKQNTHNKRFFKLEEQNIKTNYGCFEEPFLYPAITEKAWIDVIYRKCNYKFFGYNSYFDNGKLKKAKLDVGEYE